MRLGTQSLLQLLLGSSLELAPRDGRSVPHTPVVGSTLSLHRATTTTATAISATAIASNPSIIAVRLSLTISSIYIDLN